MDRASTGPLFLRRQELAGMVVQCLHKGVALGHYQLGAFVVMANHVHVLLLPIVNPSRLLQSLKGFTARASHSGRPNLTIIGFAMRTSMRALQPTLKPIR